MREPVPVGFLDGSLQPEDAAYEADIQQSLPLSSLLISSTKATASAAAQAASEGNIETLRSLANQGWKPQQVDRSTGSALHFAAGAGQIEVCRYLLDTWPNLDVDQTNKSGRTALHWAARNGQYTCCEWLVQERKANVAACTLDGINVFHWAVWSGSLETTQWAVRVKADVRALNRWGCGAIHWASASGSIEMCAWLREIGLDFTLRNNQGHDGLSKAAWNGHDSLVKWFLADPLIRPCLHHADRAGLLPADLAHINGHAELAHFLSAEAAKESGVALKPFQSGIVNQGFVVYYTTQGILSPEEWTERDETLLRKPSHLLRFVPISAASTSSATTARSDLPTTTTLSISAAASTIAAAANNGISTITSRNDFDDGHTNHSMKQFELLSGHVISESSQWGESLLLQYTSQEWRVISEQEKKKVQSLLNSSRAEWLESSRLPIILCLDVCANQTILATGDGAVVSSTLSCLSSHLSSRSNSSNNRSVILQAFRVDRDTQLTKALKYSGNICLLEKQASILSASFRGNFVPFLFVNRDENTSFSASTPSASTPSAAASLVYFDRIWVHSQSTEDGTFRLHPERLREWKMASSLDYHATAIKGLVRALQTVKCGGKLVYSTFCLDPLQNEAVVLSALKKFQGLFELLPARSFLSHVKEECLCPGLTQWLVPDQTAFKGESLFRFHRYWSEIPQHQRKPLGLLTSSLFCADKAESNESTITLNEQLVRCVRVKSSRRTKLDSSELDISNYIFIAVFSRVLNREWPNAPSNDSPPSNLLPRYSRTYSPPAFPLPASTPTAAVATSTSVSAATAACSSTLITTSSTVDLEEKSAVFSIWSKIASHYGISNFPPADMRLVLERDCRERRARSMCVVSSGVLSLLQSQQLCVARAGLKLFRPLKDGFLKSVSFRWQVCSEAAEFLWPRMSRSGLQTSSLDLFTDLLQRRNISLEDLRTLDNSLLNSVILCDYGPILLRVELTTPNQLHTKRTAKTKRTEISAAFTRAARAWTNGSRPDYDRTAKVCVDNYKRLGRTQRAFQCIVRFLLPSLAATPTTKVCWLSAVWTGDGLLLLGDTYRSAQLLNDLS